ncbi:MAG: hypothetical protein WDW38_009937 [Sanguina aurantia]
MRDCWESSAADACMEPVCACPRAQGLCDVRSKTRRVDDPVRLSWSSLFQRQHRARQSHAVTLARVLAAQAHSSRRAAQLREWLSFTGVQRGLFSLGADLVSKWG